MRAIQLTGLGLFLTGFTIFLSSFFIGNYKLTKEVLQSRLGDDNKVELFVSHGSEIIDQSIGSSFAFVNQLNSVFESVNHVHLTNYGINDDDIEEILNKTASDPVRFTIATIDEVFSESEEYSVGAAECDP